MRFSISLEPLTPRYVSVVAVADGPGPAKIDSRRCRDLTTKIEKSGAREA